MKTKFVEFFFQSACSKVQAGNGISASIVYPDEDNPFVLMLDAGKHNKGASLTNVADRAIKHVYENYFDGKFGPNEIVWVECDSEGNFDLMKPIVAENRNIVDVAFQPVEMAGFTPRSRKAMLEVYGGIAQIALQQAFVSLY